MNFSNGINNNHNNGTVMHESYQKNNGRNVEVHTNTFLLDGSDNEVGTNTTKKNSSNLMKKIMVAGSSILLVAVLTNNVVMPTTNTTDANGAKVRTNPMAALLDLDRGYTGNYLQPYCPKLQTHNEWLGKSYCELTRGRKDNLQSCFKVKGSDQHCYSDNVNIDLKDQENPNLWFNTACFPDGAGWEFVPNGEYASCGTRCLDFN